MAIHGYHNDKFVQMREDAIVRILDAACELFANNGYSATTMQMIAKKAGIVPSGIYHYYAGKEDLVEAVLNREVAAMDRTIAIGVQRYLIEKGTNAFFDYMVDSVCRNVDRISLICYLVRYRDCIPEHCTGKLKLLQHFGEILRDYIRNEDEIEQAWAVLIDFCSCAVFYSVTGHRDIFVRQVSQIKKRASTLTITAADQ